MIVLEKSAHVAPEEGDPGSHHILWATDLAKKLKNKDVRLVVLSSCESALRDSRQFLWHGVAPALLKAGIPAVIAMQSTISAPAALAFSL